MKKVILILFFAIGGALGTVQAQNVITPMAPVVMVTRPACPGPEYVWANGNRYWNKRMNNYYWTAGYWARPHRTIMMRGMHRRGWRHGYRF